MCDLVNFVLKCTGCGLQVDVHDIEDPDNAVGKLTDLQDEFQQQKPADYPLISKIKGNAGFRPILVQFIETLIAACHATGHLYSDQAIIENIEIWVSTMSSSSIRPFRHTATVISLTIGNALCKIAGEIEENNAKTTRQKDSEQKKKNVNVKRVKELEARIAEWDRKHEQVKESLQTIFDTVFVHRYRDVDPKIRVDCVSAIGTWILALPDVYFEGTYLRYLGWLLSDTSAPTRAEVIKQLARLYKQKDNVARLRTFTERFRSRLVEIAMCDSDVGIRTAAIELLDTIRDTEMLEPDDIDNIGRLIFDTEPRVRKAVARFFAANMQDLFETVLENLGDREALTEMLGEEVEDDYDSPRPSWLKLKCVAESLHSYDAESEDQEPASQITVDTLAASDSRYRLAAQTIFDGIKEAREWEAVAGYLLFDFSSGSRVSDPAFASFQDRCRLNEAESTFMLELLSVAVQGRLVEAVQPGADKKSKPSKAKKDEARQIQEATALRLADVIPKLLKKYGSCAGTVSVVLRLGCMMNLEIFRELRQESTTYAALLDDFSKQFLSHGDKAVLSEASAALLHAREFEDLEEVTTRKIQELWDDTIKRLRALIISGSGHDLSSLSTIMQRIVYLAGVADCVAVFEAQGRANMNKKSARIANSEAAIAPPIDLLFDIIHDPALDPDTGEEAAEILANAMRAWLLYYMWLILALKAGLDAGKSIKELPDLRLGESFVTFASSWPATSSVRIAACSTLLDLYTLFAQCRHYSLPENTVIPHVPESAQNMIVQTLIALERHYAKLTHKSLEEAAVDDDPESDDEDEIESEDEDDETAAHKKRDILLAEKNLCEVASKMVLALIGRVLDHNGPKAGIIRKRLERNRTRLGSNYKEIIAYLDDPKIKANQKKKKLAKTFEKIKSKSAAIVQDDEDDDGDNAAAIEEGEEEDLRNRELVEDRIVDPDEDEERAGSIGKALSEEVEDDIMGD